MKRLIITCMAGLAALTMTAQTDTESSATEKSKVFVTRDISAESLVNIYKALGRKAEGRVAVKISTGESEKTGYLRPALIKDLVQEVNGTIVECNTAYGGARQSTEDHWNAIRERGFMDIAKVDIMDEEGDMRIPVRDTTWLK